MEIMPRVSSGVRLSPQSRALAHLFASSISHLSLRPWFLEPAAQRFYKRRQELLGSGLVGLDRGGGVCLSFVIMFLCCTEIVAHT